eukprot:532736_1
MLTAQTPFNVCDNIKYSDRKIHICFQWMPKPLHYSNGIIISDVGRSVKIYQWRFEENEINLVHQFKMNINYSLPTHAIHAQFIDSRNDTLYLLYENEIHSLNLHTKEVVSRISHTFLSNISVTSSVTPSNHIHIMGDKYFRYNIDNGNVNELLCEFTNPQLVYVPYKTQLFIFGSDQCNKIFYKNLNETNKSKWSEYRLQMPHAVESIFTYDVVLAFDTLLFMFYCNEDSHGDVFCLDLMYSKLYRIKYTLPLSLGIYDGIYAFKAKNNNVHIVNFWTGQHVKASLFDLIPLEVQKCYSLYFKPLVMGFIREIEFTCVISNIPFSIKILIWHFLPSFV